MVADNNLRERDSAKVETETTECFVLKRRDLDVNEVESNTCVWDHVSRIGNIIDTAAPDSKKGFVADYILSITWEDMGCFPRSTPLVGSSSLPSVHPDSIHPSIHPHICPYPHLLLTHKEVSKTLVKINRNVILRQFIYAIIAEVRAALTHFNVLITIENWSRSYQQHFWYLKVNKFTLALLRMEDKSYAVFQYEDIQWTADHSTSSLPPEGGIFVHGVATPQLPRNNMHIEPNVWNEYVSHALR